MTKKPKGQRPPPPTKADRLTENLQKVIRQFVTGKSYHPLTESEFMKRLGLPEAHQPILENILNGFVKEGVLVLSNLRYEIKQAPNEVISGVLRVHPRGFGFLQSDSPQYEEDIFIPKHLTMNAIDGDRVEVVVNPVITEKGPEGKVVAILDRARTHMAGIIRSAEVGHDTLAYVPLLGTNRRVVVQAPTDITLRMGDRVVMEVVDWGSANTETLCRLSHHIGHITDASCDIKAAIEEYELRADFPSRVVKEAEAFGKEVTRQDIKGREDIRKLECVTIDPDTAKDFDDAISLEKDENGIYHLGVHIADVSHYVKTSSELDKEASLRCNSTYFPNFCLPMLPGALSENLCSLKPNVDRLAATVFIDLDSTGEMIHYRVARTVINSAKRFTYREAKSVLDGKLKSPHKPLLKLMVELCHLLKKKRYERGSIEFSLPELVVKVDEKGEPQGTDYIAYDITHQMVEEFMLKANEVVAFHLSNLGKNLTYRVHDEPAEENIRDFGVLARAFGFDLPEKPTPSEMQILFDQALQTPYGPYLATSFIRRMRLAVYSPDNIGHYGLALTHYTHFTSPIRRYIDLVVHRILFGDVDNREEMEQIALKCSEQERISSRAEGSVVLLKKLRLLHKMRTEEPNKQYQAVITRVKPFGFFFEVLDLMLEGFLHVSELDNDYFVYDERRMHLRGSRTGITYSTGEQVTIMPKEVDFIYLDSKWYLIPDNTVAKPIIHKKEKVTPKPKSKKPTKGKTPKKKPSKSPKPKRPSIPPKKVRAKKATKPKPKAIPKAKKTKRKPKRKA